MRTPLCCLALVLAACGRGDRAQSPAHDAPSAATTSGPDAVIVRVPRAGGLARAYVYPQLERAVWTSDVKAPPVGRFLAFDDDAGSVAFVDASGLPGRIDLRSGGVGRASKVRLASLSSADGWGVYGVASGNLTRLTPSGDWSFHPPSPARTVVPLRDGSIVLATARGAGTMLYRLRPPENQILDSVALPTVRRAVPSPLGERVYFVVDSGVIGVTTRDLALVPRVRFDDPIRAVALTPSGDRLYVLPEGDSVLSVVDKFGGRVAERIALPAPVTDLRMDPFGRYLLARPAGGDSAWVVAVGTSRLIGTVRTNWLFDLPMVLPDGSLALATGDDITLVDAETLRPRGYVTNGAKDAWFVFLWNGFRPRDSRLDRPVTFQATAPKDSGLDSAAATPADSAAGTDAPPPDTVKPRPRATPPANQTSFVVQFAATLREETARDVANSIRIPGLKGEAPQIVKGERNGMTIYRVLLGPFKSRAEAEKVGRESHLSYWVYEGTP